jgi:2-methylfumaryl-CoA isomerase
VSWGPYQTFRQLVEEDPRVSDAQPDVRTVEQPASAPTCARLAAGLHRSTGASRARRAPLLGEHTEEVLADLLGLSAEEIGALHDRGVAAAAASFQIVPTRPSRRVGERRRFVN